MDAFLFAIRQDNWARAKAFAMALPLGLILNPILDREHWRNPWQTAAVIRIQMSTYFTVRSLVRTRARRTR